MKRTALILCLFCLNAGAETLPPLVCKSSPQNVNIDNIRSIRILPAKTPGFSRVLVVRENGTIEGEQQYFSIRQAQFQDLSRIIIATSEELLGTNYLWKKQTSLIRDSSTNLYALEKSLTCGNEAADCDDRYAVEPCSR